MPTRDPIRAIAAAFTGDGDGRPDLPQPVRLEQGQLTEGGKMGDRLQRVKGKAEEIKGRVKKQTGQDTARPGTKARGTGEILKGKTRNAVGKARSAAKKKTR